MDASGRPRWLGTALFLGAAYLVVGTAFGLLANRAASHQLRVGWRLAAWAISAAVFAAHIRYDRVRLRSSPGTTALRTSLAVGLGAFGLAVVATLQHGTTSPVGYALALVLWPVVTGLPAFIAALALAAVLRPRGVARDA